MIVTVTPNPSVDRALDVHTLETGEVNRALRAHTDPGGKGINISRAFVLNGIDTVAVFPAGGPDGGLMVSELTAKGVAIQAVPIAGSIRSNITVVDAAGITTKINAPGPTLQPAERSALLSAIATWLDGATWVVGAGSLPAGVGSDFYCAVAELAASKGVRFALDTSGEPFDVAAKAGGIALIKPNEEELGDVLGRELTTVGDVVDGAREVMASGIDSALVSLGPHGALLVTADATWWAAGPPLVPLSTVGAGDTTLAGYLSVAGVKADADPAEALRTAIAWGRAAVLLPGSAAPGPEQIDLAAVTVVAEPDPSQPLKELHV